MGVENAWLARWAPTPASHLPASAELQGGGRAPGPSTAPTQTWLQTWLDLPLNVAFLFTLLLLFSR